MRVLLLFRGAPGCGKSTFIRNNGLEPYTLSSDAIRLMYASPEFSVDGQTCISGNNESAVWKLLHSILEKRMQNGDFVVVDSANSKTSDMATLLNFAKKYRYRVYLVDMTDIPISVVKKRNANREKYRIVPEFVIDKMYKRFKTEKIPAGITVIRPGELDSVWYKSVDMSQWKKIHFIGDVHGCYTALMDAIDGEIKPDEYYVFVGDYVDRGIENAEVMNYLLSIMAEPNVLFLEGNHERHLKNWANGITGRSFEFNNVTAPALENADVNKKQVRMFCNKLAQCVYFRYFDKNIFACHGGLSTLPECLTFVPAEQMIKGVGNYGDSDVIDKNFEKYTGEKVYQVHGHRNKFNRDLTDADRTFNLEDSVEFGGNLRVVTFDKNGIKTRKVSNPVFKKKKNPDVCVNDLIEFLRSNPYIKEKSFGSVSSFNFTRDAFAKQIWNEQTVKARGLYIDTDSGNIVARSYEKFFNIDEVEDTTMVKLKENLNFPLSIYKKENGFLGIFSCYNGKPFFATKSSIEGDYNVYFHNVLQNVLDERSICAMAEYCRKNNCTFVFEVVDMINDPHIIKYQKNEIFLLDIIYNEIKFRKMPYAELIEIGKTFSLNTKTFIREFCDFDSFETFIEKLKKKKNYTGEDIEGYVVEDASGYMVKYKTEYYKFWKKMRAIISVIIKNGTLKNPEGLDTETEDVKITRAFVEWLLEKRDMGEELQEKEIISFREEFLKNYR